MAGTLAAAVAAHQEAVSAFFAKESAAVEAFAVAIADTFAKGNMLLICGNGGSACDAQHITGEFVGRFLKERRALPAIALSADSGIMTAVANDYDFTRIFSRQIEAFGKPGDMLIALSTSGKSPNVLTALTQAKKQGMTTVLLTGQKAAEAQAEGVLPAVDHLLMVPSTVTARVQEVHMLLLHSVASLVEARLFGA